MNKGPNSLSKDSLRFFIKCSESRVNNLKNGQKLINAANFQSQIYKDFQHKDTSKLIKIVPKSNPMHKLRHSLVNKSLSPIRDLKNHTPVSALHDQNRSFQNYELSASIENKKLENLESFFLEKYKSLRNKLKSMAIGLKPQNKSSEKIENKNKSKNKNKNKSIQEDQKLYISRIRKNLIKTEQEVTEEISSLEQNNNNSKVPESPVLEFYPKKSDKAISLLQKFVVLNKKTAKVFNTSDIEGKFDSSKGNETSFREEIKLPVIKKQRFYDPTPLPTNFQINKDLIIPEY